MRFFNHANHEITAEVAFPLPTMTPYSEIWDEQYLRIKNWNAIQKRKHPLLLLS